MIMLYGWFAGSKSTLKSHSQYRVGEFNSSIQKKITFLIFISSSIIIYWVVSIASGILLYGVTGTYPLPNWTLGALVQIQPDWLEASVDNLLPGLYRTLDLMFAENSILQPRVLSIVFLTVLLWPFVFAAVGTVIELIHRPYRSIQVLYKSKPAEDDIQSMVDEDIQVRHINRNEYPDIRPLSILFNSRKYIFVTNIIIDEYIDEYDEPEQLKGLLLHEQYHIREQSLGFGSTLLSSLLGGANLLASFCDYRESERQADTEAAKVVGNRALRRAIIRLYSLKGQADTDPIGVKHPGAIGNNTLNQNLPEIDTKRSDLNEILAPVLRYLVAPYHLYFGGVLLDNAHMSKRERLDALRDDSS